MPHQRLTSAAPGCTPADVFLEKTFDLPQQYRPVLLGAELVIAVGNDDEAARFAAGR